MSSPAQLRDILVTGVSTKFPGRQRIQFALENGETMSRSPPSSNSYTFDPHCPECIRELWGPLLLPFAHLIQENEKKLSKIVETSEKQGSRHISKVEKKRRLKRPKLESDDHRFLKGNGSCVYETSRLIWIATLIMGLLLVIVAVVIIFSPDDWIPPLFILLRLENLNMLGFSLSSRIMLIGLSLIGTGKIIASICGLLSMIYRAAQIILLLLTSIQSVLKDSFEKYYGSLILSHLTRAWDRVFRNYQCCGWNDANFSVTQWNATSSQVIPYSCCVPNAPVTCQLTTSGSTNNYGDQNCQSLIESQLRSMTTIVIISAVVLVYITMEVTAVAFSIWYSFLLRRAQVLRRRHNIRSAKKFRQMVAAQKKEKLNKKNESNAADESNRLGNRTILNNLPEMNNDYRALHVDPSNIDGSMISITPTVVQVKRPDIHSYFYYE